MTTQSTKGTLVLKTGIFAYIDTVRSGLVPCKVLAVYESPGMRNLGTRGVYLVQVLVTADQGTYTRGTTHESSPRWIIPRKAVSRRKCGSTIRPYTIEADPE